MAALDQGSLLRFASQQKKAKWCQTRPFYFVIQDWSAALWWLACQRFINWRELNCNKIWFGIDEEFKSLLKNNAIQRETRVRTLDGISCGSNKISFNSWSCSCGCHRLLVCTLLDLSYIISAVLSHGSCFSNQLEPGLIQTRRSLARRRLLNI